MMRLFLYGMPLLAAAAAVDARPPIVFDQASLERHRLEGESTVAVPASVGPPMSEVSVSLTISPEGEVIAAAQDARLKPQGVDPGPAVAAARRWKFRPFRYRGSAVTARGVVSIGYRAPPRWRDPAATFPTVDYSNLKISLVRSACFGTCPDYSVTIDGAGGVLFDTGGPAFKGRPEERPPFGPKAGILFPGDHRARIDRATLDALIERFRTARFFGLEAEYKAPVTDLPTYVLKFETGGRSWTVTDYGGPMAGMPPVVTGLQKAVDEAAGTARWIEGDERSIAVLKEKGFDFGSESAAELAAFLALTDKGSDGFLIGLLEAGVSPERPMVFDSGDSPSPLGESLLIGAIGHSRPVLFAYLAERGWLKRMPRKLLSEVFAQSGGGCDPAMVRALVGAGADPKARSRGGDPAGETALFAALNPDGPCRGVELKPVIEALAAAGVDMNAVNEAGETILYSVEDPDLQEQLLAAGARADVRDRKGNSPVFSFWNDRIVLGLLDAGADPKGRYSDGRTLRQQARQRDMPSVLAWLDSKGIN